MSVIDQDSVSIGFRQMPGDTGDTVIPVLYFAHTYEPGTGFRDDVADLPELVFDPGFGATSPLVSVAVTIGTERVDREDATRLVMAAGQSRWEQAEEAAEALEVETAHLSAIRHATASHHFQSLRNSGNTGISVALARLLEDWRPLWLYFLQSSTDDRPAQGASTVDEAAVAWRRWGRIKGLI